MMMCVRVLFSMLQPQDKPETEQWIRLAIRYESGETWG